MQIGIAPLVTAGPVASLMRHAIYFDCEATGEASEIQDNIAQRMLAAKLVPARAPAQFAPEKNLREVAGASLDLGTAEG